MTQTPSATLLVLSRPGYDSVVVWNRVETAGATLFQFVSQGRGPARLHEIRLESVPGAPSMLTISDAFVEGHVLLTEPAVVAGAQPPATGTRTRAVPWRQSRRVVLRCHLDRRKRVE